MDENDKRDKLPKKVEENHQKQLKIEKISENSNTSTENRIPSLIYLRESRKILHDIFECSSI